jgi:tetratricopeptide (TPR) repeat protein
MDQFLPKSINIQESPNTTINYNFGRSPEYNELLDQLRTQEKLLEFLPVEQNEERLEISGKVNNLQQKITIFKTDVLKLAETFSKIELNTERLQKAKEYFDKGEITEARVLLEVGEEIRADAVAIALVKQEEYQNTILPALQNAASEYLILAQATALDFESPNRFADTCRYYEQSIAAHSSFDNLFAYAYFLQEHLQYEDAAGIYERIKSDFAAGLDQQTYATMLNNLAILHHARNEHEAAEVEFSEALGIYRELVEKNPQAYLSDVAATLNNLAVLHEDRNEHEAAEAEYAEALGIYRELAEKNPQAYLPYVAGTLNNLGVLHRVRNDYKAAEAEYTEALGIYRELAEKNPQAYLPDVAMTLNNLAVLHGNRNEYEAAEAEYREALEIRRELVEKNPQAYLPNVAMILNNLAGVYYARNEFDEVEKIAGEALNIYRELAEKNPQTYLPDLAMTTGNFAMFYQKSKPDKERSVELALEAVKILLPFVERVSAAQRYFAGAVAVLKNWGMSDEEIMAALPEDASE